MSIHSSRIFDGLNAPQREAVETLEGPLVILAGAGSGKTRVVTRRIANLIAHGVRPWEILAITFTNKAAAEMRHRVEDLAGQSGVWLSTFHSFCARLLRREAEVLGYTKDFTIYDEEDASGVIKDIIKRLGLSEDKRYSPRNVRQMISNLKGQALKVEDLDEGMFHERIVRQIYQEYENELKKTQALDFDDLLRQAVILFKDHPDVLERYRQRFRYVLVDEYQDTNKCQYLLIQQLGQKHRNVCATGDPDQSIYAWRGADVRNILSFEKDFPEAKTIKLEQNYRSTQRILQAASAVIQNNTERKPKELWTENPAGDNISYTVTGDEQLEAYEVARQIEQHIREGRRYNDIAVFYRTNSQSRAIETALIQAAIPYQLVGGTAFYERREIKDALAYLRLMINPKDDVSFRRVINVPKRALGESALEVIEQQAELRRCSLSETLDGPQGEAFVASFKPKPRQGLIQFARLLDTLKAMPSFPVQNVLVTMLDKSGLRESLLEAGETERVENLDELVNAAAEFDRENDPNNARLPDGPPPEPGAFDGLDELVQKQASVSGFLENSALLAPTDSFDPAQDRVTLMTLHMAKGLEFPIVFLTGMEEGLLPMLRSSGFGSEAGWGESDEDARAVEEERRLLYVGITRAMERLYISRAQFRRRFGKADVTQPSRFLSEIPEKLLEQQDRSQPAWAESTFTGGDSRSGSARGIPRLQEENDPFNAFEREVETKFADEQESRRRPSSRRKDVALQTVVDRLLDVSDTQVESTAAFEIGDRVKHADFGEGIVENITGSGLSTKIKVHFRNVGPKLLLLSFAVSKLHKL
ncbi:MAG TPA: UvrD-helicase domain-containing protein [Planctomycetota bacterium]|nr:UvrD-helicase domain-containing protein [Planctomycetota bacterium]